MGRPGHFITIKVCIEVDGYYAVRMRHWQERENFRLGDSHRKATAWMNLHTLDQGFGDKRLVSGPIFPDGDARK